jgi:hypothetical protein
MSALGPLYFHNRDTAGSGLYRPASNADRGQASLQYVALTSLLNLGRVGILNAARPLFCGGSNG